MKHSMNKRWIWPVVVSTVGVGVALFGAGRASSHPGHPGAPGTQPGRPVSQPAPAQPRTMSGDAHKFDEACARLVTTMVEDAHHQHHGRADENEVRAIMAAGALAGQAKAFHLLVHKSSDSNLRIALVPMLRAVGTVEPIVVRAHVTREVRNAWVEVKSRAYLLGRQINHR